MAAIEFENVGFSYDGGSMALDGLTLSVDQGEFVCVLGGNGSGKSTFAKHVNALLVPSAGELRVQGLDTRDSKATYEIRRNVGMVFQNPDDQLVASIVEDDVAFGPSNLGIPSDELRARVSEALAQVDLAGYEKENVAVLSGGQKQRVAIAGVLAMHPRILVFDEASAMLDPRGRRELMQICTKLHESGLTVIVITHFMDEAAQADRVVVFDEGRVVLDGPPEQVLMQADMLEGLSLSMPFAARMSLALGQRGVCVKPTVSYDELEKSLVELAGVSHSQDNAAAGVSAGSSRELPSGEVLNRSDEPETFSKSAGSDEPDTSDGHVVRFDAVSFGYDVARPRGARKRSRANMQRRAQVAQDEKPLALRDVTFSLKAGEFLGVAGATGSGKSTLIQLCNGLLQPLCGSVCVNGHDLSDRQAAALARRQVGLVFQYPEHQLFAATVFDDVAFGPRNMGCSEDEVLERVHRALEHVHLDYDAVCDRSPFSLSGGQQRRVAFAGVLSMRPSVLVLDEPAAGLDPAGRTSFLALVEELRRTEGLSIIMVSHDMDDLARLCDRLLVLDHGAAVALGTPYEVFACLADELPDIGLDVPRAMKLARALGLPCAKDMLVSFDALADAVADII